MIKAWDDRMLPGARSAWDDQELRKIAKAHDLENWEWDDNPTVAAIMMLGAAIAIKSLYEEGRDIEVHVHRSGTIEVWGGAYFHYQITPDDAAEMSVDDHRFHDWENDPVVKKYECNDVLTLKWDERGEMFPEDENASPSTA